MWNLALPILHGHPPLALGPSSLHAGNGRAGGLDTSDVDERRPGRPTQPLITWTEGNGRIVSELTAGLKNRRKTRLQARFLM